MRMTLI